MKTETRIKIDNTASTSAVDRRTFLTPYLDDAGERARLYRFCMRLTGDAELAEDITQEALTEAWRQADALQSPEYWRSWLYGIARHMFLRMRERQMRDRSRLIESEDVFSTAREFTTVADPEAALEQQEIALLLDRALGRLSAPSRQILEQHYISGLPQAEIAGKMGITENTAAVRLHRGREALRKVLLHELREDAVAFGLISGKEEDANVATHLWCPMCGKGHLQASKDESGRLRFLCSSCFFAMGPRPINFPSNCIFAHEDFDLAGVAGEVRGYKPVLNRVTTFWQQYLFRGQERGVVKCLGCGADLRMMTARPAHLKPYPFAGFHTHCERCRRIHVEQPLAFAFCLPEVQQFWKRHPRMKIHAARGIRNGRAFVMPVESITDTARMEVIFSATNYRVLDIYNSTVK